MAYVTITKDLTEVKDKVAFGLTKRQIVCFSLGGIAGVGTYFLTRHSLGNDLALLLLIALAAPFMLFGLYEKNGQPLEKILKISSVSGCSHLRPDLTRPTIGLPPWSGRHTMKGGTTTCFHSEQNHRQEQPWAGNIS